ncbi:MAG: sporulation protein YqfD [Candidatus Cohnella colombiensis]|uniref:Sporulation protein YqfD n=1 Tax=Candidatus Cohnella colombiensis TaxID=3121368 RepID=A0AA95JEW3_9BACL|nr:MAG: sporulation protein YqfD [Cohnella sp.]
MKGTWVSTLRGFVWVKLLRGDSEKLLNEATAAGITLWNIAFTPQGEMTFGVSIPDFFNLRPLLKRCGGRTQIISRHGLPFRMARLARRKVFAIGMLGFVVALFILSSFIWNVRLEGDSLIPEEKIRQAMAAEGIVPFRWSYRLPDTATLAQRLTKQLPEAAWVGIEKQGTSLVVTIVDSTKPEQKPLESPSHLVAKTDAVITRIVAENGRPKVERNDRVRKGDVLISGLIGDEKNNKSVVSKGTVMGLVWHEIQITSPMTKKIKSYTGGTQQRSYLVIGNRALQLSGYREEPFADSQIRTTVKRTQLRNWVLPFGTMKELELETIESVQRLTEEQAKQAGLLAARTQLLEKSGKEAVIKAENILHEQTENGKVVLTVLFEVEQSIAIPRPMVPTSSSKGE